MLWRRLVVVAVAAVVVVVVGGVDAERVGNCGLAVVHRIHTAAPWCARAAQKDTSHPVSNRDLVRDQPAIFGTLRQGQIEELLTQTIELGTQLARVDGIALGA